MQELQETPVRSLGQEDPLEQELQETPVRSRGQEDPLEQEMATTPVFFPGEFQGQRSLVGYGRVKHD